MPYLEVPLRWFAGQTILTGWPHVGSVRMTRHTSTALGSTDPAFITASDRSGTHPNLGSSQWGIWKTTPPSASYDVCVELKQVSAKGYLALLIGTTDVQNLDARDLLIDTAATSTISDRKWGNGSAGSSSVATLGATYSHAFPSSYTPYLIRRTVNSGGGTVTHDFYRLDTGALVGSRTDSSATGNHLLAGYCGIGYAANGAGGSDASNGIHFRRFMVKASGSGMLASQYQVRLGEGAVSLTFTRLSGTAWTAGVTGLSLSGSGGTLTNVTCTGASTITATFDPGSSTSALGDATFTVTNGGGQTETISIVRTHPRLVAIDDSDFYEGVPKTVIKSGSTYLQFNVPNIIRLGCNSPWAQAAIDFTPNNSNRPTIATFDGTNFNRTALASTNTTFDLASGQSGTFPLAFGMVAYDWQSGGDIWTRLNGLRITNLLIAGNAVFSAPSSGFCKRRTYRALFICDSKGIGAYVASATYAQISHDITRSVALRLGEAFDAEMDIVGFPGFRWTNTAGTGTVPALTSGNALGQVDSTYAIPTSTAYDYILFDFGVNDYIGSVPTNPYTNALASFNWAYTYWPTAKLGVASSGGRWQTEIFQAVDACNYASSKRFKVDTVDKLAHALGTATSQGSGAYGSKDNIHPDDLGAAILTACFTSTMQLTAGSSGGGSIFSSPIIRGVG